MLLFHFKENFETGKGDTNLRQTLFNPYANTRYKGWYHNPALTKLTCDTVDVYVFRGPYI